MRSRSFMKPWNGGGGQSGRDASENARVPLLWNDFVAILQGRVLLKEDPRRIHEDKDEGKDKNEVDKAGQYEQDENPSFESIRTLRIYGNLVETNRVVKDLRPCFEYLESLEICIHKGLRRNIDLLSILDKAPRLKVVEINVSLSGLTYIAPVTLETAATETAEGCQQKYSYYPLEKLILAGLCVHIFTAERIVKSCPHLRVLKSLLVLTNDYRVEGLQCPLSDMQQDSERLARLARDSCPNLKRYQGDFQYQYRLPSETRLLEMVRIFPEMEHLSKGLVHLEEFVMEAARFPGVVRLEHFEFMRKRNEPQTRYYPPPSQAPLRTATAARTRTSDTPDSARREDGDDSENDDSEDENDFCEVEAYRGVKTFSPRLAAFHVNYVLILEPAANNIYALVRGLDQIRPDVEFRFRQS
ncbi:hypothetical protein EC991_002557 [Linnemannia zychae]|nr:hypothetical protein EC991_002557 [Linnemannia zychae]